MLTCIRGNTNDYVNIWLYSLNLVLYDQGRKNVSLLPAPRLGMAGDWRHYLSYRRTRLDLLRRISYLCCYLRFLWYMKTFFLMKILLAVEKWCVNLNKLLHMYIFMRRHGHPSGLPCPSPAPPPTLSKHSGAEEDMLCWWRWATNDYFW